MPQPGCAKGQRKVPPASVEPQVHPEWVLPPSAQGRGVCATARRASEVPSSCPCRKESLQSTMATTAQSHRGQL